MSLRLSAAAIFASLTLATGLSAQSEREIGYYNTWITAQDMRNSQGAPLTDFCAMIQQDRANMHRFGRQDRFDGFDHFFANADNRSRIPTMCEVRPELRDYIRRSVAARESMYMHVTIYGYGDRVTRIYVREGAG